MKSLGTKKEIKRNLLEAIFSDGFFAAVMSVFVLMFAGCTGGQPRPSVCDAIPDGQTSVICETAAHFKVAPEDISAGLQVANLTGLSTEAYDAKAADVFVDKLIVDVDILRSQQLSWVGLVAYAATKIAVMPPKVRAAFIILDRYVAPDMIPSQDQALSDYDWALVLRHLQKQKLIIAAFL